MATQQARRALQEMLLLRPENENELNRAKRLLCKHLNQPLPSNSALLKTYRELLDNGEIEKNNTLERILIKRKVRTLSGVAPLTVLTKPFPCPGTCVYCPNEPDMPKSYLSNEPAAMRAVVNAFDPYRQVTNRLRALTENGHHPDKIDIIILGGTWSAYPKDYQQTFIHECFRAANHFGGNIDKNTSLEESQTINETARYRIIGISIETRPDHVCQREIERWRKYGVTRVQLGAQHIDDNVQKITKRGHDTKTLIRATRIIKDAGFKLDYHVMQNLPGSTPEKDLACIRDIVTNESFQPDQLKIYPTVVNEYSELYAWYKKGKYIPYDAETLTRLLIAIKRRIPYHVRINRMVRDFPSESIVAGNAVTNLREFVQRRMKQERTLCKCIRCREAKYARADNAKLNLFVDEYPASHGTELFINIASRDRTVLYAFCRLRLPGNGNREHFFSELRNAAMVRELHTVGTLVPVGRTSSGEPQHRGLGKQLMARAEREARKRGFTKCAVISGIGVREYYYKLGYRLQGTYVTKQL